MARRRAVAVACAVGMVGLVAAAGAACTPGGGDRTPDAGPPTTTPTVGEGRGATAGAGTGVLTRGVRVKVEDGVLLTPGGPEQVVADLWTAHATDVVVQVVSGQAAYYPSQVLPQVDGAVDVDVLDAMLEAAAARDLEVHAWVPLLATVGADDGGAGADGAVARAHGPDAPEADRWVTRTVDGAWATELDPALPEVRAHAAAVVGELVERYDVDGVHLDAVRYASARHGYHPRALERFRAETGASGTPAPDDAAWTAWRRAQLEELLAAVVDAAAASGRDVVVSVAVRADGPPPGSAGTSSSAPTASHDDLADWAGWAERGAVDVVVPVHDGASEVGGATALDAWLAHDAELARRTGTRVVPAVAGAAPDRSAALAEVGRATRRTGAAVVSAYHPGAGAPTESLWWWLAAVDWSGTP